MYLASSPSPRTTEAVPRGQALQLPGKKTYRSRLCSYCRCHQCLRTDSRRLRRRRRRPPRLLRKNMDRRAQEER